MIDNYKADILKGLNDFEIIDISMLSAADKIEVAIKLKCPCGNTLINFINAPTRVFENHIKKVIDVIRMDLIKHLKEDGFA